MNNRASVLHRSGAWLRLGRALGLGATVLILAASLAVAKTGPAPAPKPGASAPASAGSAPSATASSSPAGSASAAPRSSTSGTAFLGGEPPEAAYQRHLDNGIKLFGDGNFRAAITEFEAAYDAQPKASPLVNIALSHKALFDYPKAIAALKKAVGEHADTLKPEHKVAAEKEIRDLEALLAYVVVAVDPKQATVLLDGAELAADVVGKPMALSPGPHALEARLRGYHPTTAKITVTAGQRDRRVELKLEPDQGKLRVIPSDSTAWVEVDGQVPVQGGFEGMLVPGVHSVRVFKHGGKAASLEIVVVAGKAQEVTQDEEGSLVSDAARPEAAPGEGEEEGPRQGFYLHGHGAFLFVGGTHPQGFLADQGAAGAGLGLRLGYRVADWAAFEAGGQLTSIGGVGPIQFDQGSRGDLRFDPLAIENSQYTLRSLRLGLYWRILAPGRTVVRFVGTLGGGLTLDELQWMLSGNEDDLAAGDRAKGVLAHDPELLPASSRGVGGFGEVDLGVELELSRVIFGLTLQSILQSTKGLDGKLTDEKSPYSPYAGRPAFLIGPALHVGYGFW